MITAGNGEQEKQQGTAPSGPTSAEVDRVAALRIREALICTVAERGYADTSLDAILDRAEVGRSNFDRWFSSLDNCFVETWEELKGEFLKRTGAAFEDAEGWREGMRAAAWEFCRFLEEDHERARFLLVEFSFSETLRASRDLVMQAYIDLVHRGRHERPEAADVPRARAEAINGAIWEGAAAAVKAGAFDQFASGVPQMMYLVVQPYLGLEAAEQELARGPDDIARYRRGEL